ncbi:hybrid sensor histidine kinase/response regulator [Chelativorans intermedius]|uniref:histidine kinase n=1 Tax=Chelativorans intermedius TaxID=515947 RepID=A0ABV6D2R3_9HYPH|nr:ATP-binding protein [Chelativorans intermedius]MCT8997294.1 ATP-binding protein [Chelativorans intermedius]
MNTGDRIADSAGEALFVEVVEALHEGLAVFDESGCLLRYNRHFVALNPPIADLIRPGARWDVLLREAHGRGAISEVARARMNALERQIAAGLSTTEPVEVEGPNGTLFEVAMHPTATGGFVLTERDITERRRLAEAEREVEQMLRRVLDACPAAVMMTRLEGGEVIYRSPAAIELLGLERKSYRWFARPEERADFLTALLPSGRVDDMQVTARRSDGSEFPALVSARQIEHRGEAVIVSTVTDRSRELALRQALADQREQIFQAEKLSALGELLAGVAHELNNPLSVVVGHALMLRDEIDDPAILARIGKISDAAERCSRIVKAFLAMARQQPAELEPTNLAEAIEMAVEAMVNGASEFHAEVECSIAPDLPEVLCDSHQMSQVFINLLANADQAMRMSGVGSRIRIDVRSDGAQGTVLIDILDDGPGIPPEIRSRIFDPLFTTKAPGQGTGIGLAFAHRVISAHGGTIRLLDCSGDGRGACFRISLPVHETRRSGAEVVDPLPEQSQELRILVIDDEPEVADLIRDLLRRDAHLVDSVTSGETALTMLGHQRYDVILSDLKMPGLDGRGLYEVLQRDFPDAVSRMAFVTGDTMARETRNFLAECGRPWLEKPVIPDDLRKLVRAVLEGQQERRKANERA